MKKTLVVSVSALMLLSSCGTYTGAGAYTGSSIGSIIGSAIGGITGGPRGSDIGTLIGMAGGAVVGAAVGSAADKAQQRQYEDYRNQRDQSRQRASSRDYNGDGVFDETNGGDDRLFGFDENFGSTSTVDPVAASSLEIRNPRILDASRDGVLTRGEEARMVFEVYNNSSKPVYRVQPSVTEVTGNKHVHVSENVMVESILPGKGIRYTASIKADNSLRNGEAVFRIAVFQANKEITSQSQEFTIPTSKR